MVVKLAVQLKLLLVKLLVKLQKVRLAQRLPITKQKVIVNKL